MLRSPSSVFAALRDDTREVSDARQEAVTALVLLGGTAAVLAAPATGRLLDDPAVDGLLVAVLVLLQGLIYGCVGFWIGGALVRIGERALGGRGSYRRARHVLAYASAPLALSLVVLWPVRLGLYGDDVFRTGGADGGTAVFTYAELAFAAWSAALLVIGIRAVNGWSWTRAVVAACAAASPIAVGAALLRFETAVA